MKVLILRWAARTPADLPSVARAARLYPTPRADGLLSRRLCATDGALHGEFLFEDEASAARFSGALIADPAAGLATRATGSEPAVESVDDAEPPHVAERPIFVIAAPRAGGTLLLDLLANSGQFWRVRGGTADRIEGIAGLHPADADWDSHRLTETQAGAAAVRALHASIALERRRLGISDPSPRLLERASEHTLRVPFLAAAFPDARFIFLHRDARQNVSSMLEGWRDERAMTIAQLPGWSRGAWYGPLPSWWRDYRDAAMVDVAAFQWAAANERALDDLEGLPPDRWLFADYGELIASPRRVVQRALALAGLDIDEGLEAALTRQHPLGGPPPSPIKWRDNPDFHESALVPHNLLRGRLREYGGEPARPPEAVRRKHPIAFGCFLDQVCMEPAPADPDWIVHPSYRLQLGATVPMGLAGRARYREQFVRDHPIAWVEDDATRVLYPFAARREQAGALRRLTPGERPPEFGGASEMAAQLAAAGILVTPEARARRAEDGRSRASMASAQFEARRFCELPSILHPDHVAALARYYDTLIASGNWTFGDAQVSHRYGWHNEPVARYYHHQLTTLVGEIAGAPVRPSYSYVSAYRGGRASLRPHVDRRQCVYTVSLWLRSREAPAADPWPLWFHGPDGVVSLTQSAGDAVLFYGCELPHWRDQPPPGGASTTLIFHYVPNDFMGTLD